MPKDGMAHSPFNFNTIIGSSMILGFDELPANGHLVDDRVGWSETYWPSNKGGIAYRWNHPAPQPFKERLFSKNEILSMSESQLSQLSPAELYDIAQGDYSYSLTRKTLGQYSTKDLWWEGICHGWAQAAANYPEPDQVVVTNRDGVRVPFGSSDVKALLAMHDAYNSNGFYAQVGKRCSQRGKVPGEEDERDGDLPKPTEAQMNTDECRDINAGAFHLVITNMIGVHSKSFVAEIDRLNDVWNQPVVGYESAIVGEEAVTPDQRMSGIERRVRVTNKMKYGEELQFWTPERAATGMTNFVQKLPVTGTPNQAYRFKNYEYILELDRSGKIIGGEWISGTRPDFIWTKKKDARFLNGKFPLAGLNTIYRPVRH